MTGTQIYNTVWLCIWLLCLAGAIWGVCAGNPAHWLFVAASLYFRAYSFSTKRTGRASRICLFAKSKLTKRIR